MKKRSGKYRFEAAMDLAKDLASSNPDALIHLVKALGRHRQAEGIQSILESKSEIPMANIGPGQLWFNQHNVIASSEKSPHRLLRTVKGEHIVDLATDLVIPFPWSRQRIVRALAEHGKGMKRGVWRQDSNHSIELWLPQRVAWVSNGCHSITAGIIRSEGKVKPDVVYDMSRLLKFVHTDGRYFYESKTGAEICKVVDPQFAAIYEIGRLMRPANHSLQAQRVNR